MQGLLVQIPGEAMTGSYLKYSSLSFVSMQWKCEIFSFSVKLQTCNQLKAVLTFFVFRNKRQIHMCVFKP